MLRDCPCQTIVDIGANRGQFALAARGGIPGARILSFEPLSDPSRQYRALFRADAKILLHRAAIGPLRERATIHISKRNDSSSLLPIGKFQWELFPGTEEAATATVEVAPLQDFVSVSDISPPALLKIDVQGYELETLRGCDAVLNAFAYVYVECSFIELYSGQALAHEVINWLHERNFRLSGIYNLHHDTKGRAVQGDFLFGRVLT
jgi:FkbM family methyltransferase